MDSEGFDLGFEYSPLELAASQFLDVARDIGEIQNRASRVAQTTLEGYRERVQPIVAKARDVIESEVRSIAGDVRAVAASVPDSELGLRIGPGPPVVPGGIPPIAEPIPPGGPIPPVVQPGGQAWAVMVLETCGPDRFMIGLAQIVAYVDGLPVNPPPGYRFGRAFANKLDADDWARRWIESVPRTPCGEPPAPPAEPPAPSLPPFGCPPPSCVPTCPTPEPEPKKLDYCVWYREEPLDCIVLSAEQKEPPSPDYKKFTCHTTADEAQAEADKLCKQFRDLQSLFEKPGTPTTKFSWCNSELWSNADVLSSMTRLASLLGSNVMRETPPSEFAGSALSVFFGWISSWIFGSSGNDTGSTALNGLAGSLTEPSKRIAVGVGCDSEQYQDIALVNMILSILTKWIGNPPPAVTASLQYAEAFQCPWLLPSAGEAQNLFLTGVIDEQTAINLGRLNGRCDDTTRLLLESGQSRLDPTQIIAAYWRGIYDRRRAASELRARGYTQPDAFETLERTARFIPGPSDIVRFLTRDVADTDIIEQFKLDAEFPEKFDRGDEQIRRIAASQGVDRETLLYYWRAHWAIPSPTQLGEFWKRLRPSRPVDPARAGRIGLSGEVPSWSPRSQPELVVESDQIDTALGQQDILPFWRNKFRAVSFLPLTRTDARRAYDIGVLSVDDVYESLIQDGYREEDALTLTEFAYKEKNLGIRNSEPAKLFLQGIQSEEETRAELQDLGFSESAITNFLIREIRNRMRSARSLPEFVEFVSGTADEPDLRTALEDRFFRPDQIDELVATAKRLGKARFRAACTEAAKTRYLWGELDDEQAKKELRSFGWSVWSADEIVSSWACTLSVSDRLPTVRQLLSWIELGVIDVDGFRERMRRLRYSEKDTDRFLAQAVEQRNIKAGKQLEKAIRDQEAALEKERKAKERAARSAAAAGSRALKAVRSARTVAERLALAIESAAIKWAKFAEVSFETASAILRNYVDLLASSKELSAETSTKVVIKSVEWSIANKETDLATVVELLATEVDSTADALQSET